MQKSNDSPILGDPEPSRPSNTAKRGKTSALILKISLSAMFLAFAVVCKMFLSIRIPIFGAGGMNITFAGVFTFFPAILFGPLYGGCVSALSDFLGYVFKPDGAYIPWLTLTAFLGGCIKGLLWIALTKAAKYKNRVRLITAVCLVLIGAFGISTHVSLISDGVLNGFVAVQSEMPSKGETMSMELSPESALIVSLVQYNNDVITLKTCESDETTVTVPEKADIDGDTRKITKIGKEAFSGCASLENVVIPDTVTSIDPDAFSGLELSNLTITGSEGSAAQQFAVDNEMSFIEAAGVEFPTLEVTSDELSAGGFTLKSSDTFRKYLSGYINFATVGLELVMFAGLVLLLADLLASKRSKAAVGTNSEGGDKKTGTGYFLKIFISIFMAGLIVTTINTEILKVFMPAWNGRSFIILWIPRAIEEMLICLIQAYVISLLYGVYLNRIAPRFRKI